MQITLCIYTYFVVFFFFLKVQADSDTDNETCNECILSLYIVEECALTVGGKGLDILNLIIILEIL